MPKLSSYIKAIEQIEPWQAYGRVIAVRGLGIEIEGLTGLVAVGSLCEVLINGGAVDVPAGSPKTSSTNLAATAESGNEKHQPELIKGEIIGFRGNIAIMHPYTTTMGIREGVLVRRSQDNTVLYPHPSWRGRVVNALGEAVDGKGGLASGNSPYDIHAMAPPAHARRRLGEKLSLGVKVVDLFASCCKGQRLGIFSGSGVGKSLLLAMMARNTSADITVIALVGERGRELQEFIQDHLGNAGMRNCVVVVATSDESALLRRQAAWTAMAVAEYFRDQGEEVLFIMDSITRFAMAQREIGLSAGEPPTSKGFPPSTYAILPRLLERAGPGTNHPPPQSNITQGNITALIAVLVEGDDMNEPISDITRGILDGHIVLSRELAEQGQYPAVDVLRSISRTMPMCNSEHENEIITNCRRLMADYQKMEEIIRIGAYQAGSDQSLDHAIAIMPKLSQLLRQSPEHQQPAAEPHESEQHSDTDTDPAGSGNYWDSLYQTLADVIKQ